MKGDQADMVSRIRLTLPEGWFADGALLLEGLLAGLGAAWTGLYSLLSQVRMQTRLATVTGDFLDLACTDFFGLRLSRRLAETDDALRSRLQKAMRRDRATRAALDDAAIDAGYSLSIFEAARPADTGAYSVSSSMAWGVCGGWGSLQMPLECLLTATAISPVAGLNPTLVEALPAGGVAWVRTAY